MLGPGETGRNWLDDHLHLDPAIETVEDGHQLVNVLNFLKRLERKVTLRIRPHNPGEPYQEVRLTTRREKGEEAGDVAALGFLGSAGLSRYLGGVGERS